MMKKRVIGLCGFKNAGKDTVADLLVARGFHKYAFASPIKDAISMIFSWDREMLEGDSDMSREWREEPDLYWSGVFEYCVRPRDILQKFGTESMRDVIHNDIWIRSLMRRIDISSHDKFVISDVRFQNEIAAIREMGGCVFRIQRGPEPSWFLIAEQANRGHQDAIQQMKELGIHQSEYDWIGSEFDMVIQNNGGLDDLEDDVRELVRQW